MLLHETRPEILAMSARHTPHDRLPACPQCSDYVLAPLMAEHVDARHVRNHWVCESCGHAFRKSFRVAIPVEDI
jgi:ribosomal protein S27AE